jgi:hypothetical protein
MKDARNQNACGILPVKHDVPAALEPPQAGTNIVACPAEFGISSKFLATDFKFVDITDGLFFAPCIEGISGNIHQVAFGAAGKTEGCHRLAPLFGKLECPPDPPEWIASDNAAGVAFVDSSSQRGKLRLVLPFVSLQYPKRGADNLAGVFVSTAFDFGKDKPVQFIG